MESEDFDLSKMTVEDLFRAKEERRQRLANLSFEEKIAIVKKLQSVSRMARSACIDDQFRQPEQNPPLSPVEL